MSVPRYVFVVGTGRCGSTAFRKACEHVKHWQTLGERGRVPLNERLEVPTCSIVVDPLNTYFIPLLCRRYPEALWVWLPRASKDVATSWARRRGEGVRNVDRITSFLFGDVTDDALYDTAEVIASYRAMLPADSIWTGSFDEMCGRIAAVVDRESAHAELRKVHNA